LPVTVGQEGHRTHAQAHRSYLYWQGADEPREFGGVTRRCLTNIRYFQARPLRLSRDLVPRRTGGFTPGWIRVVGGAGFRVRDAPGGQRLPASAAWGRAFAADD